MPTEAEKLLERAEKTAVRLGIFEHRRRGAEDRTFIRLTPSFQEHFKIHKSELEKAHIKDVVNESTGELNMYGEATRVMGNIIVSYIANTGHNMDELLQRFDNDKQYQREFVYISWLVYDFIMDLEKHSRLNDGTVLPGDIFDRI